ncbi:hypothetical protein Q8A67_022519 [Cirrhinus molitorella]|uniref:Uncharacterized protein n=1 Tax=Cirrhinus molitorella TaxID=172907 RepID=A0AA88P906_9TELE|nr:hypothetical protein Q8A67_022519 [Cirrhinus molitorella]
MFPHELQTVVTVQKHLMSAAPHPENAESREAPKQLHPAVGRPPRLCCFLLQAPTETLSSFIPVSGSQLLPGGTHGLWSGYNKASEPYRALLTHPQYRMKSPGKLLVGLLDRWRTPASECQRAPVSLQHLEEVFERL